MRFCIEVWADVSGASAIFYPLATMFVGFATEGIKPTKKGSPHTAGNAVVVGCVFQADQCLSRGCHHQLTLNVLIMFSILAKLGGMSTAICGCLASLASLLIKFSRIS